VYLKTYEPKVNKFIKYIPYKERPMGKITSENYDGKLMVLVDKYGKPVHKGDKVKNFRGEIETIWDGQAPHKPSSTGRVYAGPHKAGVFPGAFNLKWE